METEPSSEIAKLIPDAQPDAGTLIRETMLIGRDLGSGIVVTDPTVSRVHAKLRPGPLGCVIEDMESRSGTFVNARRISGPCELLEGDRIRVGPALYRVHYEGRGVAPAIAPLKRRSDRPTSRRQVLDPRDFQLTRKFFTQSFGTKGTQDADAWRQLEALLQITTSISTLLDRSSLFREVAEQLLDYYREADRVVIFETEEGDDPRLQRPKMILGGPHAPREEDEHLNRVALDAAISEQKAVLLDDQPEPQGRRRSVLCAPLWHGDKILGAVYLDGPARAFKDDSLRFLSGVAAVFSSALQNVILFDRVRREQTQRTNLARYFSKDLVESILKNEIPYAREGHQRRATIVMTDLCGFTRLTVAIAPERLIAALNAYFGAMQRIIFQNRGTVERFGGDSILAYWGVVEADRFAAWRAAGAAIAMQNDMLALNQQLARSGFPELQISVGLNTGDVIAGDVGSEERYEFTVLGDAINMTRRLTELAGAGQILAGAGGIRALGSHALARELPSQRVKGKDQPIRVYLLYGVRSASAETGVRYQLSLPVQLRGTGLELSGAAISIDIRRLEDGTHHAVLLLSLAEEAGPGPVEVELQVAKERLSIPGSVRGDPLLATATAFWEGNIMDALSEGPFECRVEVPNADEFLRALGAIS